MMKIFKDVVNRSVVMPTVILKCKTMSYILKCKTSSYI